MTFIDAAPVWQFSQWRKALLDICFIGKAAIKFILILRHSSSICIKIDNDHFFLAKNKRQNIKGSNYFLCKDNHKKK